jgi:signal transduction histidine kinase
MFIPLEYLAQVTVSLVMGGCLLIRGRRGHDQSSILWGWGWLALSASQASAGLLISLISAGASESSIRSAVSLLSTISVLCAATFLYLGLHTRRSGRVFPRSELWAATAGVAGLAVVFTWATAPLPAEDRLFWRVGLLRSALVGLAFLALGVSALRPSTLASRLRDRALFGGAAFVWGVYLISYFGVTGWNLFVSPVDVGYRTTLQPLEGSLLALLAIGMIAWVSGEEEEKRLRAEADLRKAKKQEALGILSGGVAHEFNNLSQAIQLAAESVKMAAAKGDRDSQARALDIIFDCCDQVGGMTRTLLEYSRSSQEQPYTTEATADLSSVVQTTSQLLSVMLSNNIDLKVDVADAPLLVPISKTDLKTIILNLCINAQDAIPNGGRLVVTVLASDSPKHPVSLSVEDSGTGMSESVRDSVFEPFFTTKVLGKGTGLGLSSVHGIVTAAGGAIEVQSEPGAGTKFTVGLPLLRA